MTMLTTTIGAPSARFKNWKHIIWKKVENHVRRLQTRIAMAIKLGRRCKVKALQWILTHSFYAKLMAVRRITQNKGSKTPGVDNIIWKTPLQKWNAAHNLFRRGYKAQPLRRIYIPKKNGKLRPLGIPTMPDRAQQALYLLALDPIVETLADKNSYGFRPKRSIHDAIQQSFTLLSRKDAPKWILEGDIKACFDKISHDWLLNNILMDKTILNQWLKAGYMENKILHNTTEGTPQGGVISTIIANQTLDGLEKVVNTCSTKGNNIKFVRYADDFICTAYTKESLEHNVIPAITKFLGERGLELSLEKTKITNIEEGFDFLGFNLRKYKGKLLIKPAGKSIIKFLDDIKETIKKNRACKAINLIHMLNPRIRGWANHYKHVVAKATFSHIDSSIFKSIWNWAKRRHPNKSKSWIKQKYFTRIGLRDWCFYAPDPKDLSNKQVLIFASDTKITRHVKIRSEANPYDPSFCIYYRSRQKSRTQSAKQRNSRVILNGL